jgi:hypothetical protein
MRGLVWGLLSSAFVIGTTCHWRRNVLSGWIFGGPGLPGKAETEGSSRGARGRAPSLYSVDHTHRRGPSAHGRVPWRGSGRRAVLDRATKAISVIGAPPGRCVRRSGLAPQQSSLACLRASSCAVIKPAAPAPTTRKFGRCQRGHHGDIGLALELAAIGGSGNEVRPWHRRQGVERLKTTREPELVAIRPPHRCARRR